MQTALREPPTRSSALQLLVPSLQTPAALREYWHDDEKRELEVAEEQRAAERAAAALPHADRFDGALRAQSPCCGEPVTFL